MPSIFWALLVLFLFGALLRMDWVYYLAYVVGGVWLYTTWSVRRSVRHLAVTRHFLDHAFVGQTIPVRVTIANAEPPAHPLAAAGRPRPARPEGHFRVQGCAERWRADHHRAHLHPCLQAARLLRAGAAEPAHGRPLWLQRGALGGREPAPRHRLPANRAA